MNVTTGRSMSVRGKKQNDFIWRDSTVYRKLTDIINLANKDWFQFDLDSIEDLQYSINSFKYTQTNGDLVDLRIQAVSSDEKMLEPYGIAEVSIALVYRLTI